MPAGSSKSYSPGAGKLTSLELVVQAGKATHYVERLRVIGAGRER